MRNLSNGDDIVRHSPKDEVTEKHNLPDRVRLPAPQQGTILRLASEGTVLYPPSPGA